MGPREEKRGGNRKNLLPIVFQSGKARALFLRRRCWGTKKKGEAIFKTSKKGKKKIRPFLRGGKLKRSLALKELLVLSQGVVGKRERTKGLWGILL